MAVPEALVGGGFDAGCDASPVGGGGFVVEGLGECLGLVEDEVEDGVGLDVLFFV